MSGKSGLNISVDLREAGGNFVEIWRTNPPSTKNVVCHRATIQTKYLYENIHFCDHKDYIKVKVVCWATVIFSECGEFVKERTTAFIQMAKKHFESRAERSTIWIFLQMLESLCWIHQTPLVREAGVHRIQLITEYVMYEDTQK